MVSDSELVERLQEFLRTSDLHTTTTAIVRRRLEEEFGVDLSDKKAFIREQVDLFLQTQFDNPKEEEEGEGSRRANKRGKKVSKNLGEENKKRGGFAKVCSLSPQLQELVGVPELARTEVVKRIWAYIREKDLQDPKNKRNILCDERLHHIFKVNSINMFQMNKVLSKHIWPLASEDGPVEPIKKEKQRKKEREEDSDESAPKEKRRKGGNSGFLAPLKLSDALVQFIGTGESELSRADVVKRIWGYIKENKLQDPADKRRILCDQKLKDLFEVDSFTGFTVSKLLSCHFVKT
ncbi:Zinc finger CCCH domain-containing protein 44 [Acorus calamus]|uniref:Zinc finger CCCH domain-containing protein 44 n=1 Tax=Acorus calamus TaxID=4465 RepID=A0AAV9DJT3_ACOCL|nr:Zinc finger CCCH domain-containing protein 44 [Acorus calamus]